jgi:hypothetical protein
MKTYAIDRGGRTFYVNAEWDDRSCQYQTTDVHPNVAASVTGYQYTFARTLEGLVDAGARTYKTAVDAQRGRA